MQVVGAYACSTGRKYSVIFLYKNFAEILFSKKCREIFLPTELM
jgi:hypothetical protein